MNPADPFGLVGQALDGQFRVEKLVGEGGFSAVYRGHHLGLDEPVAIKCLKLPPTLGPQLVDTFVHRFRDESRILYRLSQGNLHIVRSIAAGTTSSPSVGFVVPYMVLEWLEGRSLASDLTVRRAGGRTGRTPAEIASLFGTAADALGFAHAQGVVHRDLNPGNLFLAQTPQGVKMKVLDFGVAKLLDDSTLNLGPRAVTQGQIRIFAPAYGAPEQFDDGIGRVGPHSDVYAFALILLEAMRDRPVNDGTNLGELANAAVDPARRPTPRTLGIDVPDAVERVFVRATRLSPTDRFANVGEMWKAFEAAVTTGGKKNDRPGAPRPAASPLGRTLPLNSPHLPRPPLARPAAGAPPQIPAVAPDEDEDDAPTRVGSMSVPQVPVAAPAPSPEAREREEEEEDVTRIRAPEPDILRAASESIPTAPPAAGAPPPEPRAAAHPSPVPPSMGGGATLMMHPPSAVPIPPPPAPFVASPPPAPAPPPPAPSPQGAFGATVALAQPPVFQPPPAMQQQPLQQHSLQQQQPMQHPMPGMPAHFAPPHQQPPFTYPSAQSQPQAFGEPPPAKKSSMGIVIAAGAVLVLGLGLIGAYVAFGRATTEPTTTAPSATPIPQPVPQPTPTSAPTAPPVIDPTPGATAETPSASAEPVATAAPTTTATATATPTATAVATGGGGGGTWAPSTATATATATPTATAVPKPTPEPVDPNAWNEGAARARLSQTNSVLVFCRQRDGQTGPGSATVTFAPDGTVSNVTMDPPYAGTKAGDCVAGQFKRAKVSPFDGSSRTIKHTFEVPK